MKDFIIILLVLSEVASKPNTDEKFGSYMHSGNADSGRDSSPHLYDGSYDTANMHEAETDGFLETDYEDEKFKEMFSEPEYEALDDEGMTTENYQRFMVSEMMDILMDAPLDTEGAAQGRFLCIRCLKKYLSCKKICKGLALLSVTITDVVPCSTTCLQRLSACCFKGYGATPFKPNIFQEPFGSNPLGNSLPSLGLFSKKQNLQGNSGSRLGVLQKLRNPFGQWVLPNIYHGNLGFNRPPSTSYTHEANQQTSSTTYTSETNQQTSSQPSVVTHTTTVTVTSTVSPSTVAPVNNLYSPPPQTQQSSISFRAGNRGAGNREEIPPVDPTTTTLPTESGEDVVTTPSPEVVEEILT